MTIKQDYMYFRRDVADALRAMPSNACGCKAPAGASVDTPKPAVKAISYAESKVISLSDVSPSGEIVFQAQRDLFITGLFVDIIDVATGQRATIPGEISLEYCNTDYLDKVDWRVLRPCCGGRYRTALGVKDNKVLRFNAEIFPPGAGTYAVIATITGIQGEGCC